MFDIDYFKEINDTYGQGVGDEVLRRLAERCREVVREQDLLGLYGGEEFLILLTKGQEAAWQVAQRLRQELGAVRIKTRDSQPIQVTASFGVVTADKDTKQLADLVERADAALYQAKRRGRDNVVFLPSGSSGSHQDV